MSEYTKENGLVWLSKVPGETLEETYNNEKYFENEEFESDEEKLIYVLENLGQLTIGNKSVFFEQFDSDVAAMDLPLELLQLYTINIVRELDEEDEDEEKYFNFASIEWRQEQVDRFIQREDNMKIKEQLIEGYQLKQTFDSGMRQELEEKIIELLERHEDGLSIGVEDNELEIFENLLNEV